MQWHRRIEFHILLVTALAASTFIGAFVSRASAQETRTIRLILPFPPGGPADVMARLVAAQIGELGGPTMVVESHPGAATEIGSLIVAHAAPPSFVVLPHFRKVGYEPLKEFVPICELATFPPLLAVNSQSPYRTLGEFVDAAHAHPGALTLGTIGPSSATQLAFEMFKRAAKADITFVPFTGYTPAIQALLGNQITAAIADYSSLQGEIASGKLRPLATTAPKPVSTLPHGVEAEFYGGVVAPAGTPEAKISSLIHWFTAALQTPQVKAKYKALGFFSGGQCGADFAAILREDNRKYGQTVADAHLRMH